MNGRDERGFVLAATLWFVALLALVAVVIEGWIASSLDRAARLGGRVAARSALFGAEQHVAYDLALGRASQRGLELEPRGNAATTLETGASSGTTLPKGPFIALDERPYRVGSVTVRLQDGAGLFDLRDTNHVLLGKLLRSYGLSANESEALATALSQYARRPAASGDDAIEDSRYRRAELPLPRHAPLLTPWEVLRIPGWEGQDRLWQDATPLSSIATPGPIGGLNANTASARLLTALAGLDERAAERIVRLRASAPFADLRDLGLGAEAGLGEDHAVGLLPSNIVRLKLIAPGEPLMRVIEIRLTPAGTAPLRVDYVVELPTDTAEGAIGAQALPEPPPAAASAISD